MNQENNKISKFISYALRHKPDDAGIILDKNGWADVDKLIESANKNGYLLNHEILDFIVENNNKKRFSFNQDKTKIKANQGHTIAVQLNLKKSIPPITLYHGSASQNVTSILKNGLNKQSRHHVHLSVDIETAINVGQRYGKVVIFEINCKQMVNDNIPFYVSDNHVWLCEHVPAKYLKIIDHKKRG